MKTNTVKGKKPCLLEQLEQLGFSWQKNGTISLNEEDIYKGFQELEHFFILATKPELAQQILSVSAYLDENFWHPTIDFLNDLSDGGYTSFCKKNYDGEISHTPSPPNREAYLYTIDQMKKTLTQQQLDACIWGKSLECPDCTKAPMLSD